MTHADTPEQSGTASGGRSAAAAASATRTRRLVGVLTLLAAAFLLYAAADLDIGTRARPGPGLMPRLVGVGLAVAGLLALVERVRPSEDVEDVPDKPGVRRQALILGALTAYIVAIPVLGFLVASALAMSVTSWVINPSGKIVRAAVVGIALAVVVDWSFRFLLNVNLPSGFWGIGTA